MVSHCASSVLTEAPVLLLRTSPQHPWIWWDHHRSQYPLSQHPVCRLCQTHARRQVRTGVNIGCATGSQVQHLEWSVATQWCVYVNVQNEGTSMSLSYPRTRLCYRCGSSCWLCDPPPCRSVLSVFDHHHHTDMFHLTLFITLNQSLFPDMII